MNNDRRKRIETILLKLQEIQPELESLATEEREAYDNMPESLQDGEKGEAANAAADALEAAQAGVDEAVESLETID